MPDAIITFTVKRYLSVTQGTMVTSGASPDVTTNLIQDTTGRVSRLSNGSFEVTGGNPQGNNPLVVQLEVLPYNDYAIEGLIIKNLSGVSEGVAKPFDPVIIHTGRDDNKVTLTDLVAVPSGVSITYGLYLLIKPKQPGADFRSSDFGLIDPLWTNR